MSSDPATEVFWLDDHRSEPVPSPTYTDLYDLSHAAAPQALRPP